MADRAGSLYQSSSAGPSGRTIVGFVASYMFSYLLLGFFLVLERVYAGRAYGVYVEPLFGNPGYMDVNRPFDGPYIIVVTLMLFVPVAVGGLMVGWITGRRSLALAFLLAVLYVFTGLMVTVWGLPFSNLVGWDIPSDEPIRPVMTYYLGYLALVSIACAVPAAYLASRIRNRVSPISKQRTA